MMIKTIAIIDLQIPPTLFHPLDRFHRLYNGFSNVFSSIYLFVYSFIY